jgi:hypothetical protein
VNRGVGEYFDTLPASHVKQNNSIIRMFKYSPVDVIGYFLSSGREIGDEGGWVTAGVQASFNPKNRGAETVEPFHDHFHIDGAPRWCNNRCRRVLYLAFNEAAVLWYPDLV